MFIKNKIPGKIFLIGEYAVLKPGNSAIIAAINRFIFFKIIKSNKFSFINKKKINLKNFYNNKKQKYSFSKYIKISVMHALNFLKYKKIKIKNFRFYILKNELKKNKKNIGFGSSGVIIVGVIKTILNFHNIYLKKIELFKLCAIAQNDISKISSCGDIAASIFNGVIKYKKFSNFCIKKKNNIYDIIYKEWPLLSIKKIFFPFKIMIGWTQEEVKSNFFLKKINFLKFCKNKFFVYFLKKTKNNIVNFILSCKKFNKKLFTKCILSQQLLIEKINKFFSFNLITYKLKKLIEISKKFNIVAKISGSGGGDCGILFLLNKNDLFDKKKYIINKWKKYNILYLNVEIWEKK